MRLRLTKPRVVLDGYSLNRYAPEADIERDYPQSTDPSEPLPYTITLDLKFTEAVLRRARKRLGKQVGLLVAEHRKPLSSRNPGIRGAFFLTQVCPVAQRWGVPMLTLQFVSARPIKLVKS